MRILVAEDEPHIAQDLRDSLSQAGYAVDLAGDGEDALFHAEVEAYDALVLDLGLPGLDGLTLLKRLRAGGSVLPVLILTARDGWRERVEGIDAGADDYLPKPFRMEELLARLRAIMRRAAGHATPVLSTGALELDTRSRTVSLHGRALNLTALEYRLLAYLLHHRGRAVPAGELLDHLYDGEADRETNAVEALVVRLRRKLGGGLVETRRGHGYVIAMD
ncbi:response regulator transcription factor [Pseudoroseomonas globiformis]|uniref:Response regulator transcription factor n=1 Tax=Teichococcus globiformis TaxID=2307229 RepID=A0ABV7G1J4_9PROT